MTRTASMKKKDEPGTHYEIRTARPDEAGRVHALLASRRDDDSVFQRSLQDVTRDIGQFLVCVDGTGQCVACISMKRHGPDWCELVSLAVMREHEGRGLGSRLIRASVDRGLRNGWGTVWLSAKSPAFYERLGFGAFSQWELPWRILAYKCMLTFRQPWRRWWPTLTGSFTMVRYRQGESQGVS